MRWALFLIPAGIAAATLFFVWMLWPKKVPKKSPGEILEERARASHEKPRVNKGPVIQLITQSRLKPKPADDRSSPSR